MIWLMILARLRGAVASLAGYMRLYPLQAITLILALLVGIQTWRVSTVKRDLTVARAQIAAGQANVRDLKAQKAAADARQAANTKRTNDATAPTRRAALSGADTYARLHPAKVIAASDASRSVPSPAAATGRVEQPAPGDGMVEISRADLDACTLNTADLWTAYQWAQGLK